MLATIVCFLGCFVICISGTFPNNDSIPLDIERYEDLKPLLDNATHVATTFMKNPNIFKRMGGIFSVEEQVKYYFRLAALPGVDTICDIGFNAGHSAITFLHSNPKATVISFDIAKLPWTLNSVTHVSRLYGDRFIFIAGDSQKSMESIALNSSIIYGKRCDLVSVDGNHGRAWEDITAAYKISRNGSYVIVDDYAFHMLKILDAWKHAQKRQMILEIDCHKDYEKERGWCLGQWI